MLLVEIRSDCEVTITMRKIPICSVEELRMILMRFTGEFYDISTVELRDMLLDKYTTVNIIDRDEIDRRKCEMSGDYNYLFDTLIECMALEVLPYQFVLYLG